jgi:ribosomal protein L7/L12
MSESSAIQALQREVAQHRQLIASLYAQLRLDAPIFPVEDAPAEGASPEILDAIRAGNKIMAIKLWREQTGSDLATAKRSVEDLERSL